MEFQTTTSANYLTKSSRLITHRRNLMSTKSTKRCSGIWVWKTSKSLLIWRSGEHKCKLLSVSSKSSGSILNKWKRRTKKQRGWQRKRSRISTS
jgi:hypothetical protein